MSDTLPPLPEMVATVRISAGFVSMAVAPIVDGKYDLYTAEQMREYAKQAVEAKCEAYLNCYSPDDTASDWADKIRARSKA